MKAACAGDFSEYTRRPGLAISESAGTFLTGGETLLKAGVVNADEDLVLPSGTTWEEAYKRVAREVKQKQKVIVCVRFGGFTPLH